MEVRSVSGSQPLADRQQTYPVKLRFPPVSIMDNEGVSPIHNQQSIDHVAFQKLREMASPDQLDELIDLFIDTLQGNLASMRTAITKRDAITLAQLAHGSKATAAGMGAKPLATICLELETLAKRGLLEQFADLFKKLETETQCVLQVVEKEKTLARCN